MPHIDHQNGKADDEATLRDVQATAQSKQSEQPLKEKTKAEVMHQEHQ